MSNVSLRNWLLEQIQSILSKPIPPAPFILWCDPQREWKEILQRTCGDTIELWTDDGHELLLRHRFAREERKPRVVWLPAKRSDLTYFRIFEGEAVIRETSLLDALREYGVEITRPQEDDVKDDLLAYVLAKLDEPLSKWKKITPDELISTRLHWDVLAGFGRAAEVLRDNDGVEKTWHSLHDSIAWYGEQGWRVDAEGEYLMQEWPIEEAGLFAAQKTLRKAFLQILDRTNTVFSEFAAQDSSWPEQTSLPYAGEALKVRLDEKKDPAAIIVVDALRFELGKRLAALINDGQASPVATVYPCMAAVPTTTELGMAYALPGFPKRLRLNVDPEKGWSVHAEGFDQNLAVADSRRNWLISVYGVKPSHILAVTDAIKTGFKLPDGKIIFLFGDEFDTQGHDGELGLSGAETYLNRYAQVVRKLRDAGYGRIFMTTDHGYFHYIPGDDEVVEKPEGNILWKTRRAVVGMNLKHKTALLTKIAGSDLECLTPRSVNAFKTYGGIGFFHRGATLQEWLIPLVSIQWAKKSQKTGIVLKPVAEITTQEPVVEIEPETRGQKSLFGEIEGSYLGRQIAVKIRDAASGKILFKSSTVAVSPKDDIRQIKLEKVPGAEGRYGQKLNLVILDADNEEILATADVTLKLDMDEWL